MQWTESAALWLCLILVLLLLICCAFAALRIDPSLMCRCGWCNGLDCSWCSRLCCCCCEDENKASAVAADEEAPSQPRVAEKYRDDYFTWKQQQQQQQPQQPQQQPQQSPAPAPFILESEFTTRSLRPCQLPPLAIGRAAGRKLRCEHGSYV